jgi:hypothetical protein
MRYLLPLLLALPILQACELANNHPSAVLIGAAKTTPEIPSAVDKIPLPEGYKRIAVHNETFGHWLRQLPLRKDNVLRLYNGDAKPNQTLHYAILDVPYKRDALQQCADAVMRLRAEYIYETKSQPSIAFLHQHGEYFSIASNCTRPALEQFLHKVFNWCGTYNLQAQLKAVNNISDIKPGDVFIRAGAPGHAMLVADVAENAKGEKMFMLLQSFIPAQEIHLVVNPYHAELGPWYSANDSLIITPGWQFTPKDLRRW